MEDKLMTSTEAAEYLKVTQQRINQLTQSGQLAAQRFGRFWLYRHSDLDQWQAQPKSRGGRPKQGAGTLSRVSPA